MRKSDPNVRIRRAIVADVPAMMALQGQSPNAAHWSREQYENLFLVVRHLSEDRQARCETLVWIVENEASDQEKIPTEPAQTLAFLVAQRIDADWELQNMAVALAVRRRGIGTLLLKELITHAVAEGAYKIFLEVRASNQSARALYRKLGFEEVGLRKSYYADPTEDALICCLRCH